MNTRTGILLLVSGPSGSGKTTLCRRLADEHEAVYSTSCTTRPARNGEQDGHDYHFLTRAQFQEKIDTGELLEHAEVHGNSYGTLKSEVLTHISSGTDVVMDIDVQGADQVRACTDDAIQTALVDLFVMPPTEEELRSRLTGRGTDTEEVIALRMKNALGEIDYWPKYTSRLLSGTHQEDYTQFKSLLVAERLKVTRIITT
ncbi:MAG: guanylate kinase [Verrucomicrobiae bacterium]|nr:guanylate kinase [Verrucomicrobiae bacterium]NNJ42094.1 guanylate kinase [Akkermansiaceae bacterium]